MNQVFKFTPGLSDVVAHSLCYEELFFLDDNQVVYKDLSFLAHNRTTELVLDEDETELMQSEIMVMDTKDAFLACDSQIVTYFQGRSFNGEIQYPNLQYANAALKQFRQGNLEGLIMKNMSNDALDQTEQLQEEQKIEEQCDSGDKEGLYRVAESSAMLSALSSLDKHDF